MKSHRVVGMLAAAVTCLCVSSIGASQRVSSAQSARGAFPADLVSAYVTVTTEGAAAPRLTASDFRIFEDDVEQKIAYFSADDQPYSVGIVWSGGTGFDDPAPDYDTRECPRAFLQNSTRGTEFFILAGDTVIRPFGTDLRAVPVNYAWSGGRDAIYIGLDVLKEAAHARKMLLIVARGANRVPDTVEVPAAGQLEYSYLERVAIRLGYQIHAIQIVAGTFDADHEAMIGTGELSDLTGGSFYLGPSSNVCSVLARDLRVQYLVGYSPTNSARDGKWRKLRVTVDSPEIGPKLRARIKRGYYAPSTPR